MDGQALLSSITDRWRGMGATQKAAIVLLTVALVVTLFYTVSFIQQANYAVLFTELDPAQAGGIVERLEAMKVPYRLSNGGTTIEVPENKVDETRIQLAGSGALLGGGVGFELFDRTRLGVTEFEQQVNYQRALTEELRRTIVQLDAVEQARVHLVIPEKSIFAEEQNPPSASVALKLRPLSELTPDQVKGIVALVAGSVEGLQPENITIIDMRGRVLNEDLVDDSLSGIALSHQEVKREYERELEKRVQSLLTTILGPNKAVAMVTADLDFRQQQSVINRPTEESAVVSEYELTEESTGTGVGGVPGTDSNVDGTPVYPELGIGGTHSQSREERTTNYEVGMIQETVIEPPGRLQRLSASVVVDGPVNNATAAQIQDVVSVALGMDPERGDQVLVSPMVFDTSYQQQLEEEMAAAEAAAREREQTEFIRTLVMYGAAVLVLLILIGVALFVARRRRAEDDEAVVAEEVVPVPVKDQDEPDAELSQQQKDVRELASQKPDEVAQIIKVWLAEK